MPVALRIATRASRLALWQAEHVAALLRAASPGCPVQIVHVSTTGDRDQAGALRSFGGMGVFTREVQLALLEGRADLAVHSMKDLPTESAEGLFLAAVPERGILFDALVLPRTCAGAVGIEHLPPGARIGTGSLRRQAQLLHFRPDLQLAEVRGNVETRLQKLDAGEYDALVLAAAGLTRLGLQERISLLLEPPVMYPAVGQGALALECRADDSATRAALQLLTDGETFSRVQAERSLLATLRAGCHAPVGTLSTVQGGELSLTAVVLSPDGAVLVKQQAVAPLAEARLLGERVAQLLLAEGADELLRGE